MVHGTETTYSAGCRCKSCRDAARRARTERRASGAPISIDKDKLAAINRAHQESTLRSATRRRVPWEGWERKYALDYTLTAFEVAQITGRTYSAVLNFRQRQQLREEWYKIQDERVGK